MEKLRRVVGVRLRARGDCDVHIDGADAASEIDEAIAVDVFEDRAFGVTNEEGRRRKLRVEPRESCARSRCAMPGQEFLP